MATVGLRDLFYAPIITTANGTDNYGMPVRMAKAIQVDLTVETAEATLYADDGVDEIEKSFVGGTITLGVNDLEPAIQAVLLGQKQDSNGVIVASGDDESPYVAIGYRATKMRGVFRFMWLYKVKFAVPNETYQTKGSSVTFNNPSIVGSFIKRSDGAWKADHEATMNDPTAQAWFEEVYEPDFDTTPEPAVAATLTSGNIDTGEKSTNSENTHQPSSKQVGSNNHKNKPSEKPS